jgi:hypothetical protein
MNNQWVVLHKGTVDLSGAPEFLGEFVLLNLYFSV